MSGTDSDQERVYHYLPVNYAGSWILMLTSLLRGSRLTFCTDLNRIADDLVLVSPHYFLNVPILLERIRSGIEGKMQKEGGIVAALFQKAQKAWHRREEGKRHTGDGLWFHIADRLIFRAVRKRFGTRLKAIICGSAPLSLETQQFFQMMGISILQVYGLTETTAICTMDNPNHVEMGWVGPAVDGVEMKLGEMDEILVKGPNIFPGYWHRPQATAAAFYDGWFRTGDQGEVNERGNWRIIGRIKNLLILSSGHNVAPEPIEEYLLRSIPGIRQAVLIGHGKSFLSALLTGEARTEDIEKAIESINGTLPHYKRIRAYRLLEEPFSIENGLLTANGKLKRDQIQVRWDSLIQEVYSSESAAH
jgi:long-chain acyl-CoA synthetase